MDWAAASAVLMGGLLGLLALGVPVAFAFLAINLVGAVLWLGGEPGLVQLARNSVVSVTSFSLTPILFFVLMGEVLFHTGVAFRAIEGVERLILRVPGRLAVVALVAGTVFSAISGSTIATTALLGSLLLPEMLKRNYHPSMAMGPIMAIGGVDMLIPPSALTVLLGSLAGISISQLLVAGVMPGLVMSAVFIAWVLLRCTLDPSLAPQDDYTGPRGWARWQPFIVYVLPLLLIFAVVIGSMAVGWATPTESAALGAAASIAAAACYGMLTVAGLKKALLQTIAISGMILFIILASTTFAQILSFSGATTGFVDLIASRGLGVYQALLGMIVILLILGCFIDQVSMMMITLPFFMPIAQQLGIDLIWLGVIFLICMQLGLLTPPFGLLLFTMKGVAPPTIRMEQVWRAALPYVVFGLAVLALIVLWPPLATWLPRVLLG
ncbi:MAG: TRAP transporter large permease [Proteobacteria bacterium]|nr:TRAP transporter large permease [Pseudomonadota bacterium]